MSKSVNISRRNKENSNEDENLAQVNNVSLSQSFHSKVSLNTQLKYEKKKSLQTEPHDANPDLEKSFRERFEEKKEEETAYNPIQTNESKHLVSSLLLTFSLGKTRI